MRGREDTLRNRVPVETLHHGGKEEGRLAMVHGPGSLLRLL
jgi:hypothetical protein